MTTPKKKSYEEELWERYGPRDPDTGELPDPSDYADGMLSTQEPKEEKKMSLSKRLLKVYKLEKYTKVNPQEMLIDDEPGGTGLPYSRRRASSSDSPQIRSRRHAPSGGKRGRELIHRIAEGERLSSDENRDLFDADDASGAERAYTNNPDKFPDSFTRDAAKKYFPNAKIGRQGPDKKEASLTKAEVDPLKSGESFTTLNNYEARKKEHDQLLREYGFPSEQDPEANRYSRFAEVETDGKGKVLHNKPPWIVAENSEMVAEINDEDAPSYSKSPKAKNREGENTMSLTKRLLNVYKNGRDTQEDEDWDKYGPYGSEAQTSGIVPRTDLHAVAEDEAYQNRMADEDEHNPFEDMEKVSYEDSALAHQEEEGFSDKKRRANRAKVAAGRDDEMPDPASIPVAGTRGKRGRTTVKVAKPDEKMAKMRKIDAMTKMILKQEEGFAGEPAGLSGATSPARKKQTPTKQTTSSASYAEPGSDTGFMPKPSAAAPTGSGGKDPSKPNTGANFDASSVTMGPNASPESLAAARGLGIKTPSSGATSAAGSTGAGSIGGTKTTANQGTGSQGIGDINEQMGLESQRGTGIQRRGRYPFDPASVGEPSSIKMEKTYNKLDKMYDDMITISKWVESKKA